jgi:hypothetical protein
VRSSDRPLPPDASAAGYEPTLPAYTTPEHALALAAHLRPVAARPPAPATPPPLPSVPIALVRTVVPATAIAREPIPTQPFPHLAPVVAPHARQVPAGAAGHDLFEESGRDTLTPPPVTVACEQRERSARRAILASALSLGVGLAVAAGLVLDPRADASALAGAAGPAARSVAAASARLEANERQSERARAEAAADESATTTLEPSPKRKTEGRRASPDARARSQAPEPERARTQSAPPRPVSEPPRASQDPAAGVAREKGLLVAVAVGKSCTFVVDGRSLGVQSRIRLELSEGTHSVSCTPEGGPKRTRSVQVTSGRASIASFRL